VPLFAQELEKVAALFAEFDYTAEPTPSMPLIDTTEERQDMCLLRKHGLPAMYWNFLTGRACLTGVLRSTSLGTRTNVRTLRALSPRARRRIAPDLQHPCPTRGTGAKPSRWPGLLWTGLRRVR